MTIFPQPKHKAIRLKGKAMEALRLACYERDKGRCQQCGEWVSWEAFHMSHIIPKAKGGDVIDNVRVKCQYCHIGLEHGKGIK